MHKKFINLFSRLAALLAVIIMLAGCDAATTLKKLSITSAKLESISPEGFRNAHGTIALGINNPTVKVNISDLSATFSEKNVPVLVLIIDNIDIKETSEEVYSVPFSIQLTDNMNLFKIIQLIPELGKENSLEGIRLDLKAKVRVNGGGVQNFKLTDIKVEDLIKALRHNIPSISTTAI